MEIPGPIKKEVEFPWVFNKKSYCHCRTSMESCGISMDLGFDLGILIGIFLE